MTTHDSALNALTEAMSAADSPLAAGLASILTEAIQELIEAELTARIGAEPHERTLARTNLRNGHRDRLVATPAGDLELKIPKLRKGSFFPELLEPRRRIDKALWAVIMTAYISGTSTRVPPGKGRVGADQGGWPHPGASCFAFSTGF
jgi:transposase-like protein